MKSIHYQFLFFIKIIFMNFVISLPVAKAAQDKPTPPPPCNNEIYHQFDFWLGEWNVKDQSGQHLGTNSITREENGCLIIERWTSKSGSTGQSYNYVDLATKNEDTPQWRQVWVSAGFTIDYTGGLSAKNKMELTGNITYRNGTSAPFKGIWTLQADGTVRQYFEQYDAKTEKWTPWFLGFYHRK